MTYTFQVREWDADGHRGELIAEGSTAQFGDKVTKRTKAEQRRWIECQYGHGKSIYMRREA